MSKASCVRPVSTKKAAVVQKFESTNLLSSRSVLMCIPSTLISSWQLLYVFPLNTVWASEFRLEFSHDTKYLNRSIGLSPRYGPFGGFDSTADPLFIINITILFGSSIFLPIAIFCWRYLILKVLNSSNASLTESTRQNSRILLRVGRTYDILSLIDLTISRLWWLKHCVLFFVTHHS